MDGYQLFDPTFMVGLAFLLLCGILARPGWKALILALKQHGNTVEYELMRAQEVLEEAKVHLEHAEAILEEFETKKMMMLQHVEHQIANIKHEFQEMLEQEEQRESLRSKTQRHVLIEDWKQEAVQHFMQALREQLCVLLRKDPKKYEALNVQMLSPLLKKEP